MCNSLNVPANMRFKSDLTNTQFLYHFYNVNFIPPVAYGHYKTLTRICDTVER